jgi:hypothetical protein
LKADIESLPINATKTYRLASNFVMPTDCPRFTDDGPCYPASVGDTIYIPSFDDSRKASYPSITIIGDGKLVLDALLRDNPDPGAWSNIYSYNFFFLVQGSLALRGITFKNGWGGDGFRSGVIVMNEGTSLSITECVFASNIGAAGGAIAVGGLPRTEAGLNKQATASATPGSQTKLVIVGSTFTGNTANQQAEGGAIVVSNNLFKREIIVIITDSVFAENIAHSYWSAAEGSKNTGGAIAYAVYDGPKITSTITGCTFRNNTADGGPGGAIALVAGTAGSGTIDMNITGCTFRDNAAAGVGGAICSVGVSAAMDISNSSFTNNTAIGASGGAIALVAGSAGSSVGEIDMNITGCTFRDNSAGLGGAIFAGYPAGVSVHITNSSFTTNYAVGGGGGQFFWSKLDRGKLRRFSRSATSQRTALFNQAEHCVLKVPCQ